VCGNSSGTGGRKHTVSLLSFDFNHRETQRFYHRVYGDMELNELTGKIIGLGIEVHNALGPGLLESSYKECFYYKIGKSGLYVEKEKPMPLVFEGVKLECGYRIDLLVENKIVIEIKSVDALNDIHLAQTLTYLKLGDYKLGLLMNFNVVKLKDGIKVNFFDDDGNILSVLTALYGEIREQNGTIMVKDSVQLMNYKKNQRLETEELHWNQKDSTIFTEKAVIVRTAEALFFGKGIRTKKDFTSYEFLKPAGKIKIKN